MPATLVAGVDSSTQSCKVVVRDSATGALVREGRAAHPDGTEVDPEAWWTALQTAFTEAGGVDDVAAVAVAGKQDGGGRKEEEGRDGRQALRGNETRSAAAAEDSIEEVGDGDEEGGGRARVEADWKSGG